MVYDVAIVGGGVIGCALFHKLVKQNKNVVLLEKDLDVCTGASKANSGLVHAGFDCEENTLKAKLNVLGNQMFPSLCQELDVPYFMCGALVVGDNYETVNKLYQRGINNNVTDMEILNREQLLKMVPQLTSNVTCGLHAKTAGIVSPWLLGIAMAESAVINGGELLLDFELNSAKYDGDVWQLNSKNNRSVQALNVINSAGAAFNNVSNILKTETKPIVFRSGEYFVIDSAYKNFVPKTVFPLPTEKGKGVLVTPTADGNLLIGPSSTIVETPSTQTTKEGLDYVRQQSGSILNNVPLNKCIRVFTGIRTSSGKDFVIEKSKLNNSVVLLAGIASPGLSAAPAIADMVANLLGMNGEQKEMKLRKQIKLTSEMTTQEWNQLIKKDMRFGKIVCRCESITEGEIMQAIHSPLKPQTVDAIKRRVRAGMGRCQGGFCLSKVINILAREHNLQLKDICKESAGSQIIVKNID